MLDLPPRGRSRYFDVILTGGPQDGTRCPVVGAPVWGFCLELERHIGGKWNRSPKDVIDIYKINSFDTARFVGTVLP
jgi:hypothetical protein